MRAYSLSHLGDGELLRALAALVARERATTAELLAHIAEVDVRRLYLPAAHPSMFSYCVHELRLSEQAAYKRIRAARAARRFPAIFTAVADGRLHVSAVVLLASYLTPENADELLEAAAHQTDAEIVQLLAQRFPRPDLPARVQPLSSSAEPLASPEQLSVRTVGPPAEEPSPGSVEAPGPRPRVTPLAPERFALQFTIGQETHDKLRYAQQLLGHQVPSGDLAQVLDRALDALIGQIERRKFAATPRPRRPRRPTASPRHIPAEVRRAVWERDGAQCTFVSEAGRRCAARTRLEFDHVQELARGGRATEEGIRLRCRAHNQFGAECTFGAEFMRHKREAARDAAARGEERTRHAAQARAAAEEVIPALRVLGFRADESRRAAALCESIPKASLEDRVKRALSYLCPKPGPHGAAPGLATMP